MPYRLLALAALAVSLPAADLSGIWTTQLTEPNRDTTDLSFRFTQTGPTVTGKLYTDNESIPLKNLKVEDTHITFTVTTELNGQFNIFTYTGTIRDNEIELTRSREAVGKKEDKPQPKLNLTLRRLT